MKRINEKTLRNLIKKELLKEMEGVKVLKDLQPGDIVKYSFDCPGGKEHHGIHGSPNPMSGFDKCDAYFRGEARVISATSDEVQIDEYIECPYCGFGTDVLYPEDISGTSIKM